MGLIDKGPESVTVYPTVEVDDGYGGTQPGPGAPVVVKATVIPTSAEATESGEIGYVAGTDYRVYARTLPAGPWSRVDWKGETWQVVGEPEHFSYSRRMSYAQAVIRKR